MAAHTLPHYWAARALFNLRLPEDVDKSLDPIEQEFYAPSRREGASVTGWLDFSMWLTGIFIMEHDTEYGQGGDGQIQVLSHQLFTIEPAKRIFTDSHAIMTPPRFSS